jgi:SAM-dependent methyltransferase
MHTADHWENVYLSKSFDTVSWYAPHLAESLRLIEQLCPDKTAAVVDIGGGQSTLVDDLLSRGYLDVSVLDISGTAIEFTKRRLGNKAGSVGWHVGDVTTYDFGAKRFDLWHDRAVFHFLTDPRARQAYVDRVRRFVKPGGFVLMVTFGPSGPLKCSGLDVVRYDGQKLQQEFGEDFELLGSELSLHHTPSGTDQQFLYSWWRVSPEKAEL